MATFINIVLTALLHKKNLNFFLHDSIGSIVGIQQCMGIACNRAFNSGVKNILPDPDLRKKLGSGSRYLLVCTENLVVRNLSEQSCL